MDAKSNSRRRVQGAYLITTISISLVLFMLGLIGLLLLNARKLSDYVKENISLTIIVSSSTNDAEILRLQNQLHTLAAVKSAEYITREQSAKDLIRELGEDFVSVLGENPLPPSIDVKLYAQYANPDSIIVIEKKMREMALVEDVLYEKSMIHLVNDNVRKVSMVILGFSGLLLLISIALINNTVRLLVYSRRFIIRTMQLVGATRSFISKPVLMQSLFYGFIASIIAMVLISAAVYVINQQFQGIYTFHDFQIMSILFGAIVLSGLLINWICTYIALRKYLKIDIDQLY